mmetsp:Transcript_12657/g.38731  ORF Transcript_12657/g.38731 Transcript_12657/m.38731 type:complete len:202 (+) Transcript_12657:209-814(+)
MPRLGVPARRRDARQGPHGQGRGIYLHQPPHEWQGDSGRPVQRPGDVVRDDRARVDLEIHRGRQRPGQLCLPWLLGRIVEKRARRLWLQPRQRPHPACRATRDLLLPQGVSRRREPGVLPHRQQRGAREGWRRLHPVRQRQRGPPRQHERRGGHTDDVRKNARRTLGSQSVSNLDRPRHAADGQERARRRGPQVRAVHVAS